MQMSVKELTIKTISQLPETVTINDICDEIQRIYDDVYLMELKAKLAKADDDIKNGRVMSLEDFEKEMDKLYEDSIE